MDGFLIFALGALISRCQEMHEALVMIILLIAERIGVISINQSTPLSTENIIAIFLAPT